MAQNLVIKKKEFIETPEEYVKRIKERKISFYNIPKKIRTYEMCIEAVKISPYNLKDVPEELITEELCLIAIEHDFIAMRYVPKKIKNKRFCLKAITINEECIRFLPSEYIDDKMTMNLIMKDGKNIRYIDEKKKTKELCLKAFENNPSCIEYLPAKYVKDEMFTEAVKFDCNILDIVPERLKTKELIINTLQTAIKFTEAEKLVRTRTIGEAIPIKFESDKEIIDLERKCGIRKFVQKKYDKDKNKFYVKESFSYKEDLIEEEFDTFDSFYEYINYNLINADLFDYDFKGIAVRKIDYENAFINSDVLIENNLYDPSVYESLILNNKEHLIIPYENDDVENTEKSSYDYGLSLIGTSNNNRRIYYISDLHLYHKIEKRFPNHASKIEIIQFINKLIDNLIANADLYNCLFIGGDTSSCFEITKIFFKLLRKKWKGTIITILGNHEIWNINNEISENGLDDIILKYREFFNELEDVILLHNELLFFHEEGLKILNEKEIQNSSDLYLKELSNRSRFIILGGLGFSGLNEKYNANCGLYRNTISNVEYDLIETNKFNNIYEHMKKSLENTKLIVFTHTQKEDWNSDDYIKNWIYVNGHTHQNNFIIDENRTVYSDNQIGYYKNNIGLKFFELSKNFDYFQYLENGIYEISRDDYFTFNRGIGLSMDFNKIDGKLIMLKKNGIYCFLYKNAKDKLYILNGGAVRVLENQDVNYYYNTMDILSMAINTAMENYNNALKDISKYIKSIGGSGRIHGCIIDIDWFNHIYLNPYDGKISYYYATSIVDKYVYNSLKSLLTHHNEKLLEAYENKKSSEKEMNIMLSNNQIKNIATTEFVPDTFMYSPSRQMLTIQYLTELKVIRFWNDEIIDKLKDNIEVNKLDYKD